MSGLYFWFSSRFSVDLVYRQLTSHTGPLPSSLDTRVTAMAQEVYAILMALGHSVLLRTTTFALVLLTAVELAMTGGDLLLRALLIPNDPWARDYLSREREYVRRAGVPTLWMGGLLMAGFVWWVIREADRDDSAANLVRLAQVLTAVTAATIFVSHYLMKRRAGLFRHLANSDLSRVARIRVLLASFFTIALMLSVLYAGIAVLERPGLGFMMSRFEVSATALDQAADRFASSLTAAERDSAGTALREVRARSTKLRRATREMRQLTHAFLDGFRPTIGVLALVAFVIAVYIPLLHCEVRYASLVAPLLLLGFLGVDAALKRISPGIFRISDRGPTGIVVLLGIAVVAGEVFEQVVKVSFAPKRACWFCRGPAIEAAVYCVKCGSPLPAHGDPEIVGNRRERVAHRAACSYVQRMRPNNMALFAGVAEATAAGYVPCNSCAPGEEGTPMRESSSDEPDR